MKFSCTYCNSPIEATEEHYGTNTNCPHCDRIIRVPDPVREKRVSQESIRIAELHKGLDRKQKSNRKIYLISSIIGLVIICCVAVFFWITRPPLVQFLESTSSQKIESKRPSFMSPRNFEIPYKQKESQVFLEIYAKMPKEIFYANAGSQEPPTVRFSDGSTGQLIAVKQTDFKDAEKTIKTIKQQDFQPIGQPLFVPVFEPEDITVAGFLFVVPKKVIPGNGLFQIYGYEIAFSVE